MHNAMLRALSRIATAAVATIVASCAGPDARATTLLRLSPAEASRTAAAIVRATAKRVDPRLEATPAGDRVFEYSVFDVEEVLKGDVRADRPLVLKHLGGEVDGTITVVEGEPHFEAGAQYLLYLAADDRRPYECYFVQGFENGVWRVRSTPDGAIAERTVPSVRTRDAVASTTRLAEALSLADARALASDRLDDEPLPAHCTHAPQIPPGYAPRDERRGGTKTDFVILQPSARWFEPDANEPVAVYVNPGTFDGSADLSAALSWAAAQWSSVSGSALRVENAGPTDACGFARVNRVSSVSGDCANEVPGTGCSSGVIAIGGPRTLDQRTTADVNGEHFVRIVSGDVVVNDGTCDLFANQQGLNAVVTHELGHVLGFDHSALDPGDADRPTMFPSYFPGMDTLATDDEDAVRFVYPAAPEPPEPDAPSLRSASPAGAEQGEHVRVVLLGAAFAAEGEPLARFTPADGLTATLVTFDDGRIELDLSIAPNAAPGNRSVDVVSLGGRVSNRVSFAVRPFAAPRDLRAEREGARHGRRGDVLLQWTDSSDSELAVRVERLDQRSGHFVAIADALEAGTTAFRDERPPRKAATYRLVYEGASGASATSNVATASRARR